MKKLNVIIPIVTPLTDNDEIDIESLENLVEFLIEKDVDGIYPCGTTGEMAFLTDEERKLVVETVVKKVAGRVLVYAQVGASNTDATIALAQHAEKCGVDGIGVVTPWYHKVSDDALLSFYKKIAACVSPDFPVYLYGIPQCAVNDISPALAQRIAEECPNIVGMKYSYPDIGVFQEFACTSYSV